MPGAGSAEDCRTVSALALRRATDVGSPSCPRTHDRISTVRCGFDGAIAADRQFAERIAEQLLITLLLPSCPFGLPLASDFVIGGASDRGEIVEIRSQDLAPR